MNKPIIKTAFILSKKGMEKELRESLREIAHKTKEEKGCIQFEIHENMDKPEEFILWEHFVDKQAFDDHLNRSYTKRYFETNYFEATSVINMAIIK